MGTTENDKKELKGGNERNEDKERNSGERNKNVVGTERDNDGKCKKWVRKVESRIYVERNGLKEKLQSLKNEWVRRRE